MAGRALNLEMKKLPKNEPNTPPELPSPAPVTEEAVAILAYQLWMERGCPIGSDKDDWFEAESRLKHK